ncbi:S8 family peptidase [Deinococcus sonorensis]|uniref:S8 family serine peptidase n=2 Tax=Deinococcus sonorensis TaxID=309891 RepID=A0AAU7UG86_9DEIO
MTQAEAVLQDNPQYIVVFHTPDRQNLDVLAQVLEVPQDPTPNVRSRASRQVLHSRNGVHARIYTRLAVAVANLTPPQRERLAAHPAVRSVARNQRRSLPPQLIEVRGQPETGPPEPEPLNRALEQLGLDPLHQPWTGRHVKVAVLDTGVDLQHPDLSVLPGNAVSFVPDEPDPQDQNGHGTHCAGVIAGRAYPQGGFRYGVAPDAELLIGKVLNRYGQGYDDQILDAIDWAVDQGAHIISLSLGSARAPGQPASAPYEQVAATLLQQGVLLVAAAGNESQRPRLVAPVGNPAACPSILAVAAIDGADQVAAFSSGDVDGIGRVDLAAPGVGIYSAWPGGGHRRLSGTSMATPHVAGVLAMFRERSPAASGPELWTQLCAAARPLPLPAGDVGAGAVQVPTGPP